LICSKKKVKKREITRIEISIKLPDRQIDTTFPIPSNLKNQNKYIDTILECQEFLGDFLMEAFAPKGRK